MLAAAESASSDAIVYCGWQNLGLGGGRDEPFIPPEYEHTDKVVTWLGGCRWPIHAVILSTEVFREAGGFDEALSSCMDYDLWLRVATNRSLIRVPHVLAYYHHHGTGQITGNRAKIALNHWRVQRKFIEQHPEEARRLGRRRIRALILGELLQRGYVCYWRRELPAARAIFRIVMKHGYGTIRDYLYMLPAWLPEAWHCRLIHALESRPGRK
jgi:GT2 family glycosyltransferase